MNNRTHNLPHRQQGAVLAISLIILLLMTMIGVTAMQTTTLEEKMAGNSRDRDLALQSTESALRDAEALILGLPSTAVFSGDDNGLYSIGSGSLPDYTASITWDAGQTNSTAAATAITGISAQPRYYIQHVKEGEAIGGGNSPVIKGYGANKVGVNPDIFRITARGVGGSPNAQVLLRTHFGMIF